MWEGGNSWYQWNQPVFKSSTHPGIIRIQCYTIPVHRQEASTPFHLCNKKLLHLLFTISSVYSSVYILHLQICTGLVHFEKKKSLMNSVTLFLVSSRSPALAVDLVKRAGSTTVTMFSPFAHYSSATGLLSPLHYWNVFSEITDGPIVKVSHQTSLGLQSPFLLLVAS